MYLQKYSYLSNDSPKNTKFGIKLILSQRIFPGLSGMQIILFEYSLIFMKTWAIREKTQEKWGIQLSCLLLKHTKLVPN